MVWYGGPFRLHTCPVLALTPEVRAWEAWFYQTHQVVDGQWQRVALPGPGSVGQQDARLMAALDQCRATANHILRERRATPTAPVDPELAAAIG